MDGRLCNGMRLGFEEVRFLPALAWFPRKGSVRPGQRTSTPSLQHPPNTNHSQTHPNERVNAKPYSPSSCPQDRIRNEIHRFPRPLNAIIQTPNCSTFRPASSLPLPGTRQAKYGTLRRLKLYTVQSALS